jgi:hypothetical protein
MCFLSIDPAWEGHARSSRSARIFVPAGSRVPRSHPCEESFYALLARHGASGFETKTASRRTARSSDARVSRRRSSRSRCFCRRMIPFWTRQRSPAALLTCVRRSRWVWSLRRSSAPRAGCSASGRSGCSTRRRARSLIASRFVSCRGPVAAHDPLRRHRPAADSRARRGSRPLYRPHRRRRQSHAGGRLRRSLVLRPVPRASRRGRLPPHPMPHRPERASPNGPFSTGPLALIRDCTLRTKVARGPLEAIP